jgi:hypothetical protein
VGVVEIFGGTYGNKPGLIKAQLLEQRVLVADIKTSDAEELKKALAV